MRRLAPLLILVAFAALALHGLGTLSVAHDDEAWLSMPGWSFWETGRFGSPAFEGFHGAERRYYQFLPLFPILDGGAMHLLGPSLAAARLVPLAFVLTTLALTWALAKRLLSEAHAFLALLLLAFAPVSVPTSALPSGIPMLDVARLVRNDATAAAFGIAALLVMLPALARGALSRRRAFAAGLLGGLALLGHVTSFAIAAALLLALALRRAGRALPPLLAGFALPLLPYALWVAWGFRDFLAQNRGYAPRFAFSTRFFARNIWEERARWRGFTSALRHGDPAALLFAVAVAAGLVLLWKVRRAPEGLLLPPLLLVPSLFALFLAPKNATYLASVWPLLAIAASVGILAAWRAAPRTARAAVALALAAAAVESLLALRSLDARIRTTTPHEALAARLLPHVPPGARLLAMNRFWYALGPSRPGFRSMIVPIFEAAPSASAEPVPFGVAADRLRPDLVLVDPALRSFLDAPPSGPNAPLARGMAEWLAARCRRTATLEDPSYGTLELWTVTAGAPPPAPPPPPR